MIGPSPTKRPPSEPPEKSRGQRARANKADGLESSGDGTPTEFSLLMAMVEKDIFHILLSFMDLEDVLKLRQTNQTFRIMFPNNKLVEVFESQLVEAMMKSLLMNFDSVRNNHFVNLAGEEPYEESHARAKPEPRPYSVPIPTEHSLIQNAVSLFAKMPESDEVTIFKFKLISNWLRYKDKLFTFPLKSEIDFPDNVGDDPGEFLSVLVPIYHYIETDQVFDFWQPKGFMMLIRTKEYMVLLPLGFKNSDIKFYKSDQIEPMEKRISMYDANYGKGFDVSKSFKIFFYTEQYDDWDEDAIRFTYFKLRLSNGLVSEIGEMVNYAFEDYNPMLPEMVRVGNGRDSYYPFHNNLSYRCRKLNYTAKKHYDIGTLILAYPIHICYSQTLR
ncbi:MAG: hypothetical protein L7T87_04200 [Schleiferiaceae bacterium]|nr:hypothetical protein [Schleiferiaceae bacterium]